MSTQRVIRGIAFAAVALASSAAGAAPRRSHPHFDDRGTLAWYLDLDEARAAARASGRLIFIDYGRLACGNCRRLVTTVLPNPAVRERLGAVAVGLASDCDRADPRVERILAQRLGHASMLPFVAVVTHDLRWVTGWSGGMEVHGVSRELATCESFLRSEGPTASIPSAPSRPPRATSAAAAPRATSAVAAPRPTSSHATTAARPALPAPARATTAAPARTPTSPPAARAVVPAAPRAAAAARPAPASPAPAAATPTPAPARRAPAPPAPCATGPLLGGLDGPIDECGGEGEMHCEGGVCYLKPLGAPKASGPSAPTTPRVAPPPPAPVAAPLADPRPVATRPSTSPGPTTPGRDVVREPARPRVAGGSTPRTAGSTLPARPSSAGPAPRAALSAPAPRTSIAAARPALPSRSSPVADSPRPARPPTDRPGSSRLERAREAAAEGRYGDVIRLGNEAQKDAPSVDSWEMDHLVRRARTWALDGMNDAVQDALRGDYDTAARTLERVRVAMAGLPAEIDAERGQRALLRLADIARGSPDAGDGPDSLRKAAYAEFRGTRWAVLFKAS
jgi:hypothetical protein